MEFVSLLSFITCCYCLLLSPLLSFSSSSFLPHLRSSYPVFPFLITPILPSFLIYFPTSFFHFLLALFSLPHLHFYNSSSSFLHTPITSYSSFPTSSFLLTVSHFFFPAFSFPSYLFLLFLTYSYPFLSPSLSPYPFLSFPFLPLSHFLFSPFLFLHHLSSPSLPSSISSNSSFLSRHLFSTLLSPSLLSFPHRRQIRKQHITACLFKTHVLLILV